MDRTAGSAALLIGLGVLVAHPQAGCDPATPQAPTADVLGDVLLGTLPEVLVPALDRFSTELDGLEAAVQSWEAGETAREDVRSAWIGTLEAWQEVVAMPLGPLGSSTTVVGGQDLAEAIYSWPLVNDCLVDQKLVEGGFDDGWFDANRTNAYGLDALERLLYAGPDNACPGQVPLNSEGTWAAFTPEELDAHRATMAVALVGGLQDSLSRVRTELDGFALDAATHGSEQEALNAIYDAWFTLETGVKDAKLAEPFGQRECTLDCLELVESRGRSALSHRWLAANLRGARTLYLGAEGAGLDDLLIAQGREGLADDIRVGLDEAVASFEALDEPLDVLFERDEAAALALFEQVRVVTDLLKEDVPTTLALVVPQEAGGDND